MVLHDIGRTGLQTTIDEWIIGDHAERDRAILSRRLLDGVKFEKLSEEFDLSVRYIKTIVYRCEAIISAHLPG